jgi:hypothetical protein
MSHIAPSGAPIFMGRILMALVLAAPLAAGCMVRSNGHGPPAHASGGWRGGPQPAPPPSHVPPGQIRRAEVHERNEARKADHKDGHGHGHHPGRGHDHDR